MSNLHTKTFKIELKVKSNEFLGYNELKELVLITQNLCSQAGNKIMLESYLWEVKKIDYKKENGKSLKEEEVYGKKLRAYLGNCATNIIPYLYTSNPGALQERQYKIWKSKDKDKVINNESQLPFFTKTYPIDIKNDCWEISKTNKGYDIKIKFFSREAKDYFKKQTEQYQEIVKKEEDKEKKKQKNSLKYYQNKLKIYQNILNYIEKDKNKNYLIFNISKLDNNKKSIINNILNCNELVAPFNKIKNKLKSEKTIAKKNNDKQEEELISKNFNNVNKDIEKILEIVADTYKQGAGQLKYDKKMVNFIFSVLLVLFHIN